MNKRLVVQYLAQLTWLFACLFESTCFANNSQPYYSFKKIDVGQVLGRSHVLKVIQDHEGFIWAATQDGLYRYDGYQLKAFRHNPDDPNTLPGNYILNLFVDSSGTLWVATIQDGIAQYNPQTESFIRFNHDPNDPYSLSHNMVFAVTEDHKNQLWFATYGGGLNRFEPDSQQFKHFRHNPEDPNSLANDKVTSVICDSDGRIWAGTAGAGVSRWDPKRQHFQSIKIIPKNTNELKPNIVLALLEDSNGEIWASTDEGGLSRYDAKTDSFYAFNIIDSNLNEHTIYDLIEDPNHVIWIASRYGGLLRLDPSRQQLLNYRHQPLDPNSLSSDSIFSLTLDRDGLIWLSLFNDGLNMFDPKVAVFGKKRHWGENLTSQNNIRAIAEDHAGNLWIGGTNGLDRMDKRTEHFIHYQHVKDDPSSLSSNDIRAIFSDSRHTLWVATQNGGLNKLSIDGKGFEHLRFDPSNPNTIPSDTLLALAEDKNGSLWIGGEGGLAIWNNNEGIIRRYIHSNLDPNSLSSDTVNTFLLDNKGRMWIGTSGGLNLYHPKSDNFTSYLHQPGNPQSLSHNRVLAIHQDRQETIWVGTAAGLNRFDEKNQQFNQFREKDGLANDAVFNITDDNLGNLWLGLGEKSLATFNLSSFQIKNDIGQQANCSANQSAHYKARDGKLYFGGDGYCAFYPEKVLQRSQPPQLALTNFYLLHNPVQPNPDSNISPLSLAINHTESITLSHRDNVISFEFAALHFLAPERNQYRYRLAGFDQNWINTSAQLRRATYTNLPAGEYTFEVQGSNYESVWNPQSRQVALKIRPAPWLTWWAMLAYAMLASAIVASIVHQRYLKHQALILAKNNAELAKQNAEKANRAKTLFVADISHEIRTPLNAVLGYTQLLERDPGLTQRHKEKVSIIEKSGNHLLGLINNILDISKIEAGAMTLQAEDFELVDMLKSIILMLAVRSDEKGIELKFVNLADNVLPVLGDQGKLRQILINIVGNAVKFTEQGSVTLTLSAPSAEHYKFEIRDTGIGISAEHHHTIFEAFGQTDEGIQKGGTGLGLAIACKQVALMNGQLALESSLGKGCCFYFTLPLPTAVKVVELTQQPTLNNPNIPASLAITALVVEDLSESAELLKLLLQDMGITVLQASQGQHALERLSQLPVLPEIIFIDIKMPVMDGKELLLQIKQRYAEKSPPCIAISAHAMPDDVSRFQQLGFDRYISKPFKLATLYQCIASLLNITLDECQEVVPDKAMAIEQLCIPAVYLYRLKAIAEDYEITLLEECLAELETVSEHGRQLTALIKPYLSNYDMEGLLEALEHVNTSD